MNSHFQKLSTLTHLFSEARMPNMAGPDQSKPIEFTEQEAGTVEGKVSPASKAKAKAEAQQMLGKLFKGMDSATLTGGEQNLGELAKDIKAPTPKTETLAPRDMAPSSQETVGIGDIDTSRARELALMTDLQRAAEAAKETKLTNDQATKAMTTLVGLLADMGPETNLREDNYPTVRKTLLKALNGLPDRDVLLATVHNLKAQHPSPEDERVVRSNLKDLTKDLQGRLLASNDQQLLATLSKPGERPATSEVATRKTRK